MGAFDDLIPAGGAGAFDDLIPRKKRKDEGGTAGDYASAISQSVGGGVLGIQARAGTFLQAPAANTFAGLTGARALADRGITAAMNWAAPGSAALDEDAQTTARQASRFAAEQRAANVDTEGGSWLNPRTAIARLGLGLEQDARQRVDEIEASNRDNRPELIRQQQAVSAVEGFLPTVKAMAQNPLATIYTLGGSLPDMVAGLGLAKFAAARSLGGAGAAADAAAARAAAAGGDAAAQAAAAKAVVEQASNLAVARASTVGTLAEAVSSASSAREGVYREVMGIPATQLVESPRFREILAEAGGDAARAQEILANELADQAVLAGAGTLLGSALTRRIFGGDTTAKAVAGQRIGFRDVIKNVAEEGTEEGLQGVPEDLAQYGAGVQADPSKKFDVGGTLAQNVVAGALMGGGGTSIGLAKQGVQDLRNPAGAAAAPAGQPGAGAPSGAVNAAEVLGSNPSAPDASIHEGGGSGAGRADEWRVFPPESGTLGIPREEMPQIDAQHRGALVNFLEARGIGHEQVELDGKDLRPSQAEYSPAKVAKYADDPGQGGRSVLISADGYVLDGHHQWVGSVQAGKPVRAIRLDAPIRELLPLVREFPSAGQAEGAAGVSNGSGEVNAQRALLAPKRLTELDRVHEIDGQLASRPADSPEAAALRAERDAITKNWPATVPGASTTFSTEAGARVGAQYALIEADKLLTSHDVDLRPNPAYPKELQPRERDRAASAAQISGIVQKIDPARLGLSADAATGAPIIGADGLVESGNARSIALARVYQANGQKAEDYRAYLRNNAAQFGLTPEAVAGMRNPVLVRIRTTPVNRAEFARQANASTVAQMSPAEQARSDAARIDAMDDLRPDENGDFTTSRDFIRRFIARLPGTEQAGMVDAGGQLSSAGYARVRNAVLAKAYGDSPVLARMVESMDDSARNISRALMIAAPRVAQARAAIGEGRRFDADLTPHLVEAAQEIQRLKDAGQSVSDALAQAGVFGETYSPETRAMLQFLADNARRPRRMAEFIAAYFDALDAAGDPAQGSLLGETEAPAKSDLMAAARRTTEGVTDADATNPERRNAGETAPDRPGDRGQPEDAADDRRGGQSDGAAGPAAFNESTPPREVVSAIDLNATPQEKVDQLVALTEENKPIVQALMKRIDAAFGTKSGDNVKAPASILAKAKRPSILATKPWYGVEHVRDSYRFKTVLQSLTQLPEIVRMLEESGINIVKRDTDKVLEPGPWGWRIAAFDLQMPNGQLVEYYLPVAELEAAKKNGGHLLFEEGRNASKEDDGSRALMQRSRDLYQAAWDAYLARTGDSESALRASLNSAAAADPSTSRYPSSKSVSRDSGAGEVQAPSSERSAENPGAKTQATDEPASSTNTNVGALSTGPILSPEQDGDQVQPLQDLSRVSSVLARAGWEKQYVPRMQASRQLAGLLKQLDEGALTEAQFEAEVRALAGRMDQVVATKAANRAVPDRERGADIVREKLIRARRQGDLDHDTVDFALWALDQNPALATGLGISITTAKADGAAGDYNPAAAIMRVFKGAGNTDTAVHEILHHTERMMPPEMQEAIRAEWAKALAAAMKKATAEQRAVLELIPSAMAGQKAAHQALVEAIQRGPLTYAEHYQLVNPSEFWAVNAARLMAARFAAKDSVWGRVRGWLGGMVEQVKGILGLRSDAPILKALGQLLEHDGTKQSKRMLSEQRGPLGDIVAVGQQAKAAVAERAEQIIRKAAATPAPIDAAFRAASRATGLERAAAFLYGQGAKLIDRLLPETFKAGFISDYGVPDAVIDQRAMMQGRQRQALRGAGVLLEKLATMTRAESRVAYAWMTGEDARSADDLMKDLPPESVKVLQEVRALVDQLSAEAVRLGQLDAEARDRHRFAYLRRSYVKHARELQTPGDRAKRQRAISILGDQYKGRGMTDAAAMKQIQNIAPEWWKRKTVDGRADTSLKGEKFVRLERRAASGEGTAPLEGMEGKQPGKLLEVHYFPAGEALPAKYSDWDQAGTWEVRGTKGSDLVMWRDFTKDERVKMGEIDEARFAIAKTLQGMIHDIEVGRYLEWLATTEAKKPGEAIEGTVVEASERYRDTFKPGDWVLVPDTKIPGTSVPKYGKLAGRYLPGPVWNDLRQVVGGQFRPLGDTYQRVLSMWKTAKTALSPAVHTNNVMSNFVMADWHDVSAGHVAKATRIILGAMGQDGRGLLGRAGNAVSRAGMADRAAAREIIARYQDSGGSIGSWVTQEIAADQLAPIVEALERELAGTAAAAAPAEIGVYSAVQHLLHARFPAAFEALKASKPGAAVRTEAKSMIDLYQAEDEFFRLAAWLKAKEGGATDAEAGKIARRSFLDYSINAPWVQAMRSTAFPFISFSYRAIPMLLETAGKKPHKLLKLMALAGALNWLGVMLAGGGDDNERKLLPEEKAGGVWGLVPKLVRMPWNDANGSPVYLDIRRWIPVGDVADLGQGHSAVPIPPSLMPGGPLAVLGEVVLNRSAFTGKAITLDTDTALEKAGKVFDHLWKAAAPNVLGLPGTYATQGVVDAVKGRTDAFGREQSVPQAMASTLGVKVGSYPADVLKRNIRAKLGAATMEIDRNIAELKRQRQTNRISQEEFAAAVKRQREKELELRKKVAEQMN
ncbi:MAG: hypothetical protein HY855_18855 [Burkholderiales bacterium]|nr:hypothetical protein [Burkholderiales bacterium]